MRRHWKPDLQHELSWFLIAYLLMLLSVLMLVHLLQPERDGADSSSRSPVHQARRKAASPAVLPRPDAYRRQAADSSARAASRA